MGKKRKGLTRDQRVARAEAVAVIVRKCAKAACDAVVERAKLTSRFYVAPTDQVVDKRARTLPKIKIMIEKVPLLSAAQGQAKRPRPKRVKLLLSGVALRVKVVK